MTSPDDLARGSTSGRRGPTYAGVIIFLCGFFLIFFLAIHYFLIPAYRAYPTKSLFEQRQIRAVSLLLLVLLLVYLFLGLMLTFKISRHIFPRRVVRTSTHYIDAWAESGKRLTFEPPHADPESLENP